MIIDSIAADGLLTVTLDQTVVANKASVVDYHITQADGRALPSWLERPSIDLLQGKRDANIESLDLKITAILSNGEEVVQLVRINTATGDIQQLPRQRAELLPPMFQDQFRSHANLTDRQTALLAAALAD